MTSIAISSNEDEHSRERLSILHLVAMLCSNFTNGLLLASYMLLTLPLEAELIDEDWRSVVLGSLMFIAGLTQLINPLAGLVSDRCTCRWGKRRPFVLAGAIIGIAGLLGQYFSSEGRLWWLYYISYGTSMIALNMASSAVVGLLPDLVPTEQLGTATGIAALETVVGASCAFVCFWMWPSLQGLYTTYIIVVIVTTAITMVSANENDPMLALHGDSDGSGSDAEHVRHNGAKGHSTDDSEGSDADECLQPPVTGTDLLMAYWIDPVEHRDFSFVFWSRTFYYMGISVQTFFKYFVRDMLGSEHPETVICKLAIVSQIAAACTAVPCGLLSDRLGGVRKPFVYGACAVMAAGYIATIWVRTEFQFLVTCGVVGAANGVYLAMDQALAVDTLPDKSQTARFLGVWGIGCFLGGAAGPMVGGPILKAFGHVEDTKAYNPSGYYAICVLAAIYFIISGLLLIPVRGAK